MTKITRFELLRRAFIHRDQAFKRVPKIMQNYAKMHRKSPQNEHEKMWIAVLQWSETHVVASPAKMHQNAFIFVFPGVALLTPWTQKSFKIVENWPQNDYKKNDARSCNDQNRTLSNDLQNCIKTRSFLSFPVLFCSRHGSKIRLKSSKIIDGGMHGVYGRARREAGQFEVYKTN